MRGILTFHHVRLERTNDLAEAGIKAMAYLLALSWDRAIVSFIFSEGGGRVSDLWGYAASAMVVAGMATLNCCLQARDASERARQEAKSRGAMVPGTPDAGRGDDAL